MRRPALAAIAGVLTFALAFLLTVTQSAESHPLHTSLAEISYDPAQREAKISIRVFADDFSRASAAYAASKAQPAQASNRAHSSASSALAYTRSRFVLADAAGRQLPLAYCGGRRVADLIWLCFHTSAPRGLAGLRVSNGILFDLYSDQINIVQVTYNGRKSSLLFTHGDGFKRLG